MRYWLDAAVNDMIARCHYYFVAVEVPQYLALYFDAVPGMASLCCYTHDLPLRAIDYFR